MGTRIKVAVLDDYQGVAQRCADWEPLRDKADVAFYHDNIAEPAALVRRLRDYDVVCLMRERTRMDDRVLPQLPKLKLIVTTAMRNAALDIALARRLGITVCGTGAVQTGTPELVWLHILAHARRFEQERAGLREGRWQVALGQDLHGATLGLLGLGRVGERVARVGQAFGMKVLGWSPHLTPERAQAAGAEFASKQALFARADFVVIALQLRESTRHIVGQPELDAMKPHAYLVNTSRAGLVDEDALIAALRGGRIAGAGLDVFQTEPLPREHAFRSLPNATLTPHIGYVTVNTYEQFYRETVEDVCAWLAQSPIRVLTGAE